ncbi:DNA repair protein XRCC3 isoform X2 [Clinocottus analis]|uniref:DNA repair protein XRCC3 isoform X2 n=1 Tax=Clinocottus analis TaxID=304258 RepID=UPI0035C18A5F
MELHPRVLAAVRRDLQRLTGLCGSDVQQLLTAAASSCRRGGPVPVLLFHRRMETRLGVGCPVLDRLLRGGLPAALSELAGESGAGKTQLALQLCLSVQYPTQYGGLDSGAVYICTEDSFPSRRLLQLIRHQPRLRSDVPPSLINSLQFSDRVYIEHAADLDSLQACLTRRVPLLLARGRVRLLVVDSVAALFRSDFLAADWLARTKGLLALSSTLHHLSLEFTTPVLCINQVTDVFSGSGDSLGPATSSVTSNVTSDVTPALGLAWANQVTVRLVMRRLQGTIVLGDQSSALRRLEVVFAPHLPPSGRNAGVWREGVRGEEGTDGCIR